MDAPPHTAFAAALRDRSFSFPAPQPRFAIYRSNRLAALTESLAATFAATERIVGSAFFREMAHAFIAAHPPRSAVLHEYGAELPDFVAIFAAAASLPYLADVARIEWAWMRAYHAEDIEPIDASALSGLGDEALLAARLQFHPSAAIVRSNHPSGTIWQMNTEGGVPAPICDWRCENVLVWRPQYEVQVRIVPDETAAFLAALAAGATLSDAARAGTGVADDFDLAAQLGSAFALGLVAGLLPPRSKELLP